MSVENKIKLHEFHVEGEITCMVWTEEKRNEPVSSAFTSEPEQQHYLKNAVNALLLLLNQFLKLFFRIFHRFIYLI